MKKFVIVLVLTLFLVSLAFANEKDPIHGPTVLLPKAEIGGRAVGDDCTDPIVVTLPAALPYTDANQTNCGRLNNYSDTCLGSYDGGEDIIYRLDVTADVTVDISMDPSGLSYTGISIDDECPDTGTCIDLDTGPSGIRNMTSVALTAGNSYYIMVDTWPSPDCIPDFDLTITAAAGPPANDLCADAIELTVGSSCSFTTYTTLAATDSGELPAPTCGNYSGSDVWFSFTVPSTGTVTIDSDVGAITDGAMNAYSGSCGSLVDIECDDDDSANGFMPILELTGLTPSDVIYIRFWEYNGDNNGTFDICAWDPTPAGPPSCTTEVSPLDGATGLAISGDLEWNAAATATGYKLYFGTDGGGTADPVNIVAGLDQGDVLTYTYSGLAFSTVHYWKIVPYNVLGDATGCTIWDFTTEAPTYCTSGGPSSTADSNVEQVDITGEGVSAISHTGCPGVVGVEDLTSQFVDLKLCSSYTLDVTFGTCGSNYGGSGEVWIDWNQDKDFEDTGESIGTSAGTPGTTPWDAPVSLPFTVPSGAATGTTRMRIMQMESGTTPFDPCASFTWGSVMDFTVNVDDGPCPVTLSSFSAIFANDLLTINWATESELNNLGWNIYRGLSDNPEQALQINNGIIPGAGSTSEPTHYSYTDISEVDNNTTYWYWLESASFDGATDLYGPVSLTVQFDENPIIDLPDQTQLFGNHPNPFNPDTFIEFDVKDGEQAKLTIYNIRGQNVMTKSFEPGSYNYNWQADSNPSGVYFYRLESDSHTSVKKMLLLK